MNINCNREIDQAQSVNEIVEAVNKYYDLDQPFGMVSGGFVKAKLKQNFNELIKSLGIHERSNHNSQTKKRKLF